MIQVGKLRTFINDDGQSIGYFKTIKNFNYSDLSNLFSNFQKDIGKFLPQEEQYNLFYTVAHHTEGDRKFKSWQAQDIIPFDLDGIDLNRIDEYPHAVAEALNIDITKCGIVYTGNGIHVLVQVPLWKNKDYIKQSKKGYGQCYDKIVDACNAQKLPITKDTTAWDYGRILRCPFTVNRKTKDGNVVEKNATLNNGSIQEQAFTLPVIDQPNKELFMAKGSYPLPDNEYIMSNCKFMEWLKSNPDDVHEPHAYAMLSITAHFQDEQATSKEYWERFSSPSINSKELVDFTEQALDTSGPRTCEGINNVWGKCNTCPHYQKVTSPIQLKNPDFIGTAHCGFSLKGARGGVIRQYDDLLAFYDKDFKHKSVGDIKKVYIYTGTHFRLTNDTEIKNFAFKHFLPLSKSDERNEFLNLVKDSNFTDSSFLDMESNKGFINLANGVLEIKTKKLLQHDIKYGFLYCLPYKYNEKALCPNWDKFIDDITLNRDCLKNVLHEYLGYILSGSNYKYQKALILDGGGKNGKTTFIKVAKELVGFKNVSNISLDSLQGNIFSSSGLHGKLLNISEEEPPKTFKEKNGVFKNLTGDGTVNAQYKFGDAFEFKNRAKIIISYNEMPYISDTSKGMLRRLMVVPCDLDLESTPDKVNPNIEDDLFLELEGIFNKCLDAYYRLEKQKDFTKSNYITDKVKDILNYSDVISRFIDECLEFTDDENDIINTDDLYSYYLDYHDSEGENVRKMSKISFGMRLKKFKEIKKTRVQNVRKRIYVYKNVKLYDTMGKKVKF